MDVLYQDAQIIVCVKPVGAASQEAPGVNMPALIRAQTGCRQVYPVHRLDTGASGVMAYAKTAQAAAGLSRQIADGGFCKEYLAAAHGRPEAQAGEYTDLLFRDAKKNKTYVVRRMRRGVKEAKLAYTLLCTVGTPAGEGSLLRVTLFTGRTHQIRVQFASRGTPLFGDGKYGARDAFSAPALFSCRLAFVHPQTGAPMEFTAAPPAEPPWTYFPL